MELQEILMQGRKGGWTIGKHLLIQMLTNRITGLYVHRCMHRYMYHVSRSVSALVYVHVDSQIHEMPAPGQARAHKKPGH